MNIRHLLFCIAINTSLYCVAAPPTICTTPSPVDMSGAVLFGNGTPGSCTQAALQQLLNTGGKIKCNCGTAPFTLTLNSTLTVPLKEVVLDGNNLVTISGNNATRIFDKAAAANQQQGTLLVLQNLILKNGNATNDLGGGAITGRAFGSLRVFNTTFESNTGPLSNADACGAVHTILYKDVLFSNCTFSKNKGANGGAVGTIGSGSSFINCVFDQNEATGTGGTFDKGGSGGAVYVDGVDQNGVKNTLSLCGCIFTANKAGYQAGALNVIFYAGKGSTNTVDRCSFENNSCSVDKGGAFYHMNGPLTLTQSLFLNNSSPAQGGGLWISNTKLTLSNTTFSSNKALSANENDGLGGAVCIDGSGSEKAATISFCTFFNNRAGNFASAIFNGGTLTFSNNILYKNLVGKDYQGNPYGGGAINKGSSLTVPATNLQFPSTYVAQFGTNTDDWITGPGAGKTLITDAQLSNLADNGGPTKTMALPSGSPAVNKGSNCPAIDQRGFARTGSCDLGAFEQGASLGIFESDNNVGVLEFSPNPVNREARKIWIKNIPSSKATVRLTTLSGNTIWQKEQIMISDGIDLTDCESGTYILDVTLPTGKKSALILIQ